MKTTSFQRILGLGFLLHVANATWAQQQDVPEPIFLNFSIQPPYVPSYHGRDPFKPLDWVDQKPQVSITDLEYHGIVDMNGTPMALFEWRMNSTIRYTLKYNKLLSDAGVPVAGIVGKITPSQVVLVQGGQKIVYPRR